MTRVRSSVRGSVLRGRRGVPRPTEDSRMSSSARRIRSRNGRRSGICMQSVHGVIIGIVEESKRLTSCDSNPYPIRRACSIDDNAANLVRWQSLRPAAGPCLQDNRQSVSPSGTSCK